jgi:hypothetical protein
MFIYPILDIPHIKEVILLKLAVPFAVRIFLVVVLVGAISVLVILDTPVPEQSLNANVVQGLQQPGEPTNTLIISGIDIGQSIGFKSPTISGNEFSCFNDKTIVTDRGRSDVKYFLRLRDPSPGGFNGCRIEFAETEDRKTGLFMRCPSSEAAFAFIMFFDPSLDSTIEDNELVDFHEETIPMFRAPYTIVDTKINTGSNRVDIRFISPAGSLDISDTYNDNLFSDDVRVNGKRAMNGQVRIRGTASGDEFRMQDIEYRLYPQPVTGKDVFVGDHQGFKQHLRTPEAVLGDFDILFRGVGSAPAKVSTPKPSAGYGGGNTILFDAVGDDTYNLIFINNQGRRYKFPIATVEGGLHYGDEDQDFEFMGAGFVIDQHDYFAVSDKNTRNGVTNIVEYSTIDSGNGKVYFKDVAGGETVGNFDTATGAGTVVLGGTEYDFEVDVADPNFPLKMDFDNNGAVGGEANIVVAGGPRIDLAGGMTGALEIDESLFADEAPPGGESINFAFMADGNDIDIDVTSGVDLIKNDATDTNDGLSQFGVFVQLGDRSSANDLVFMLPSAGGMSGYAVLDVTGAVAGGQAQGEVLITCERSEFVKKAQAAKK